MVVRRRVRPVRSVVTGIHVLVTLDSHALHKGLLMPLRLALEKEGILLVKSLLLSMSYKSILTVFWSFFMSMRSSTFAKRR